jgi:hypothetical protein
LFPKYRENGWETDVSALTIDGWIGKTLNRLLFDLVFVLLEYLLPIENEVLENFDVLNFSSSFLFCKIFVIRMNFVLLKREKC